MSSGLGTGCAFPAYPSGAGRRTGQRATATLNWEGAVRSLRQRGAKRHSTLRSQAHYAH